ncbi:4'-phosphopantetheinyl transferase superfamily protein [Streptomyces sp. N35]|uniref:4'-phosphopantetheinyl transferase family protein n=1 Tax=Streptomyces sp. N35 TaxID=2795730 RepID=UPI0027DC4C80|nr:4'-phosphopantetheinyl transferase superfamily protein [Streptomyces sp. N35]
MIDTSPFGAAPLPTAPPKDPEVWAVRGLAGYAPVLDAAEHRRAGAFRHEADRETYVAAHTALRVVIGACLGEDPLAVRFTREDCPGCGGPHGRPVLAGTYGRHEAVSPQARPGSAAAPPLHFSLSHTHGLALIALAATPVGVDVEALPGARTVADVASTLHPDERGFLAQLPAEERPFAFARCWTRKEAYLKGTGEGLGGGGFARTVVGAAADPLPVPGWTLTDVRAPHGYAAAVAVRD